MIFRSNSTSSHAWASGKAAEGGVARRFDRRVDPPLAQARKKRVANPACMSTSPPDSVTPPPEARKRPHPSAPLEQGYPA
jgi:hypothetical protein